MSIVKKESEQPKVTSIDDILEKFNLYGRYHILIGTLIFFGFTTNSLYSLQFMFVTEQRGYRCIRSHNDCNPVQKEPANQCYQRVPINEEGLCLSINETKLVPCTDWVYDDPDGFTAHFQLPCQEWKQSMIGTVHSFGYMIGLLIMGPISDRIGRKPTLIATGLIGGLCGVSRSFASSYFVYIILEFIEGAIGDMCSPAFIMVMEIVSARRRPKFYMLTGFGYVTGSLLLTLCAWQFQNWKQLLRVLYTPAFLFIFYIFLLDESPRWLLSKGRFEEAKAILQKAAKMNGMKLDKAELEILKTKDNEEGSKNIGYGELIRATFHSRTILGRFLVCVVWWITSTLTSYGIAIGAAIGDGNGNNRYLTFALIYLVDFPCSLVTGYTMEYFRRKKPLFISFLLAAVIFSSRPFLPTGILWLEILFVMTTKALTSLCFSITYVFTSELFPTYTRNSMHSLCSSFGRIGSMMSPHVVSWAHYWFAIPAVVYATMSFLAATLTLFVPDTAADTLPDTVQQAEVVGHDNKAFNKSIE